MMQRSRISHQEDKKLLKNVLKRAILLQQTVESEVFNDIFLSFKHKVYNNAQK